METMDISTISFSLGPRRSNSPVKLISLLGMSVYQASDYVDLQEVIKSKAVKILGNCPGFDEFVSMREQTRSAIINNRLDKWEREASAMTEAGTLKQGRILGIDDQLVISAQATRSKVARTL